MPGLLQNVAPRCSRLRSMPFMQATFPSTVHDPGRPMSPLLKVGFHYPMPFALSRAYSRFFPRCKDTPFPVMIVVSFSYKYMSFSIPKLQLGLLVWRGYKFSVLMNNQPSTACSHSHGVPKVQPVSGPTPFHGRETSPGVWTRWLGH